MRELKRVEKELINKINDFREFAKSLMTYKMATEIFVELKNEITWFLNVNEYETLHNAWRLAYVNSNGLELDMACNKIIEKIISKKQ